MAEELNAEVGAQKNAKQNRFNKTKKAVKRVTDGNNQRNRDIYSQSKAQGRLFYLTSEKIAEFKDAENDNQANHHENHLIDILDAKNSNDAELEPLIERKEAIEEILKKDIPTKQSKEELNAELVLIKKELNLL